MLDRRTFIGSVIGTVAGVPFIAEAPPELPVIEPIINTVNPKDFFFVLCTTLGDYVLPCTKVERKEDKLLFYPEEYTPNSKLTIDGWKIVLRDKGVIYVGKFRHSISMFADDTLKTNFSVLPKY